MTITEPVPRGLEGALRVAVADLARAVAQRAYGPALHVGVPGRVSLVHEIDDDTGYDQWLRVDLLEAMVAATRRPGPPPMVWLTRRASLELCDLDAEWLAAVRAARRELGQSLIFTVMNHRGWRDPASDVRRVWQRRPLRNHAR